MKRSTLLEADRLLKWESDRLTAYTQTYGPFPINIFKQLREADNLTHEELSSKVGLTRHSLIRAEQGVFANPPPSLISYWSQAHSMSELYLMDQYEHFQLSTRLLYKHLFGEFLLVETDREHPHPLKQLRLTSNSLGKPKLSVMQVAKYLCVPQFNLHHWETHWKRQQSVPKAFAEALISSGYAAEDINYLGDSYKQWRANQL